MFGIKTFLGGLLIGGVGSMMAMQYHVVRTNDGTILVPRSTQLPLRSAYVDIREWNASMWTHYPDVSAALAKSGRTDLMLDASVQNALSSPELWPTSNSDSVASKAKQAMDALIPIKSGHQANKPVADWSSLTSTLLNDTSANAAEKAAEQAMQFQPFQASAVQATDNGVPVLQKPVPVPLPNQGTSPATGGASAAPMNNPSVEPIESPGWMKDLLKSLVPGTEQASTTGRTPPIEEVARQTIIDTVSETTHKVIPQSTIPRKSTIPDTIPAIKSL